MPVTAILQLTKPTSGRCSLFIPSENTRGFLMFSWGIEMEDYPEIGYSLWKQFWCFDSLFNVSIINFTSSVFNFPKAVLCLYYIETSCLVRSKMLEWQICQRKFLQSSRENADFICKTNPATSVFLWILLAFQEFRMSLVNCVMGFIILYAKISTCVYVIISANSSHLIWKNQCQTF